MHKVLLNWRWIISVQITLQLKLRHLMGYTQARARARTHARGRTHAHGRLMVAAHSTA